MDAYFFEQKKYSKLNVYKVSQLRVNIREFKQFSNNFIKKQVTYIASKLNINTAKMIRKGGGGGM